MVWYGVVADVRALGRHFVTGKADWKARKSSFAAGHNQDDWKTQDYNSCNWPKAIVRPNDNELFPGKARSFPYNHDAKYVWAEGAFATDSILLRLVVGGESCPKLSRSTASLTFSATNGAELYVNGKRKGVVSKRKQVRKATARLGKGDVVAIIAEAVGVQAGGVIADISMKTGRYKTGQSGWKAVRSASLQDARSWMMRWFDSCDWPDATVRPYPDYPSPKKAKRSPIAHWARYVWANGAGENDAVVLRFVVGGENCPSAQIVGRQGI